MSCTSSETGQPCCWRSLTQGVGFMGLCRMVGALARFPAWGLRVQGFSRSVMAAAYMFSVQGVGEGVPSRLGGLGFRDSVFTFRRPLLISGRPHKESCWARVRALQELPQRARGTFRARGVARETGNCTESSSHAVWDCLIHLASTFVSLLQL